MVNVGDKIPSSSLVEKDPHDKIDIAAEIGSGDALIIGVPAAFSPTCSDTHVPGYIAHPKIKDVGKVFVVSVNDVFVMNAWGKSLDGSKASGIRFLGDPAGKFTRALDLEFDAAPLLGTNRSKRYAILVKKGKVESINVEPDNIGVEASVAEKVLG